MGNKPTPLTQLASGGGCGCKLSPVLLRELLQQSQVIGATLPPQLLVGAHTADDAAVWRLSEQEAIIATTDFFSPIVDDAYDFGRIAATNAISDIYAMGGKPLLALVVAAMPKDILPSREIAAIFSGGREQCRRAGIIIAGGHSIDSKEPLYGLAVIGRAHPEAILTNAGARAGDVLLLGKPLGIGILSAVLRQQQLPPAEYGIMLEHTTQLNSVGGELAQYEGVHAMTDVTGFGLLGHLEEMCQAADVGAQVKFAALPLLPAAVDYAKRGIKTGASDRNWQNVESSVRTGSLLADWQRSLLTDPQTSGGLLVACSAEAAPVVQAAFVQHGQAAVIIGEMTHSKGIEVQTEC